MPGWGQGQWGLSTWGLGSVEELYLTAAYPTSVRSVRVELSRPARSGNPSRPGDATNPSSWTVRRGTSGPYLTVLGAAMVGPLTVELYVLERLSAYPDQLTVAAVGLVDSNGALVGSPSSLPFLGLTEPSAVVASAQRDLRSPPFDTSERVGGTLRVTTAGDYETHSGTELLKKLIIRRLTTTPGGFAHLPNYGLGLQVKEPLILQDLQKLRAEIRRQLSFEPEIATADAQLTFSPETNLLTVRVRAILVNSETLIETEVAVPIVSL